MYRPKSVFRLSCLSAAISLAACGGDSNQNSSSNHSPELSDQSLAVNGFDIVTPNQDSYVDLQKFITGDNVRISNVKTLTSEESCGQAEIEDLQLKINIKQAQFCQYSYDASQTDMKTSQDVILSVLASSADNPSLAPISDTVLVDSGEVLYDLESFLGSNWLDTYSLVTDSVSVVQDDQAADDLITEISGNTITFTPGSVAAWVRITYVVTDSAAPDEDRLGVIYVSVLEEANEPPSISPAQYSYQTPVTVGQKVVLDLDTLPELVIRDPEGESWQLTYVDSFTATVNALNPDSIDNQSIEFETTTLGEHFVHYIVADHSGGTNVGVIKVNAIAKDSSGDWDDINTDLAYFTAPLTYQEADSIGYKTTSIWDQTATSSVAGFTGAGAEQYCMTNGAVPSINDFQHLFEKEAYASQLAKWPRSVPYLALEKLASGASSYKTFDLLTGIVGEVDENRRYFVACSKNRNMSLDITNRILVADGLPQIPGSVTMPIADGSFDLNIITSADLAGFGYSEEITLEPGYQSGNDTDINASSTRAGTFVFSVTDSSNSLAVINSPTITFVGNKNTGQFGPEADEDFEGYIALTTERNGSLSDGYSTVKILANLSDINDNPLEDQNVKFAIEDPNSNNSAVWNDTAATTTNAQGDVAINVANTDGEELGVTAFWTRPDGTEKKGKATISFAKMYLKYPCEGLENPYGCIPVLPYKEGTDADKKTLFTAGFDHFYAQELFGESFSETLDGIPARGEKDPAGMILPWTHWSLASQWCAKLRDTTYLGRDNWELPMKNQLMKLFDDYHPEGGHGELINQYGWPTMANYWTNDYVSPGIVYKVSLYDPYNDYNPPNGSTSQVSDFGNTSCVSVPVDSVTVR